MHAWYKFLCMIVAYLLAFFSVELAIAHDENHRESVITTGNVSLAGDLSLPQAKLLALNQARASAIEQASGIAVTSSSLIRDSILAGSFIESLSKGYIVEETILGWESDWYQPDDSREPPVPILRVQLQSIVEVPKEGFLQPHAITAHLNKTTFTAGENAAISIIPADDMYLLVVNYTASDKIVPIFPNQYAYNNLIPKGVSSTLPNKNSGFTIELAVSPGSQQHTEAFFVFGFPRDTRSNSIEWLSLFPPGEPLDYDEFHRRIVKLPVAWLAEKVLAYEVYQ